MEQPTNSPLPLLWNTLFDDQPLLSLIIFSNLDYKFLYRTCSHVCKRWFNLYFRHSLLFKASDSEDTNNSTATTTITTIWNSNSIADTLLKICYFNTLGVEIIERQVTDLYGKTAALNKTNDDGDENSYYDESMLLDKALEDYNTFENYLQPLIELEGKIVEKFKKIIYRKQGAKKISQFHSKRKLLTTRKEMVLIPMLRNPVHALQQVDLVGKQTFDYLSGFNRFIRPSSNDSRFIIISHDNNFDDNNEDNILNIQVCDDNERICKIEYVYHAFMQKTARSKFSSLPSTSRDPISIYSLYVLVTDTAGEYVKLRKLLICDKLYGKLEMVEEYNKKWVFESPLITELNLKIPSWDAQEFDICLLEMKDFKTIHVLCEGEITISFVFETITDEHKRIKFNQVQYNIHSVQFVHTDNRVIFLDSSILNFTNIVKCEGFSLTNPKLHSNFAFLQLKVALLYPIRDDCSAGDFEVQSINLLVVKNQPQLDKESRATKTSQRPFSSMWYFDKHYHDDDDLVPYPRMEPVGWQISNSDATNVNSATFHDQGRVICVSVSNRSNAQEIASTCFKVYNGGPFRLEYNYGSVIVYAHR